jgi:proteasome assembly chaperone (PAC2) family protein
LKPPLREPWLVAAWPGMGAVAQIAASHLVRTLEAEVIATVPPENYFDVSAIPIENGLVQPAIRPRSVLYGWRNPAAGGRDLIVLVGDQQPQHDGYAFCEELLDIAEASA